MAKTRAPYAPEFRERLVELARSGRTPEELSKEFEPAAQSMRNWVCQVDLDEGCVPSPVEKAEMAQGLRLNVDRIVYAAA